jgi:hypothetical protein
MSWIMLGAVNDALNKTGAEKQLRTLGQLVVGRGVYAIVHGLVHRAIHRTLFLAMQTNPPHPGLALYSGQSKE